VSIIACSVSECERKHYCRGYCKLHYQRMQRHGDAETTLYAKRVDAGGKRCSIEDCEKESHCRSMCAMHYQRWRKRGSAEWTPAPWPSECKVTGCDGRPASQSLCQKHYARFQRYGDPVYRIAGEIVDGKKICTGCKRDLPIGMYRKATHRGFNEFRTQCNTCSKKYIYQRRAALALAPSDDYKPVDIFTRDGWVCQLCDLPIDESLAWPHRFSASVDHILPISKGGGDVLANVQAAHLTCNISKGAKVA